MAEVKNGKSLVYKNHPLRRVDNLIYYGSMADPYIVMLQILDSKKEQDMEVATRVSVQLQLTAPDLKSRTACTPPWMWAQSGWIALCPASNLSGSFPAGNWRERTDRQANSRNADTYK